MHANCMLIACKNKPAKPLYIKGFLLFWYYAVLRKVLYVLFIITTLVSLFCTL